MKGREKREKGWGSPIEKKEGGTGLQGLERVHNTTQSTQINYGRLKQMRKFVSFFSSKIFSQNSICVFCFHFFFFHFSFLFGHVLFG